MQQFIFIYISGVNSTFTQEEGTGLDFHDIVTVVSGSDHQNVLKCSAVNKSISTICSLALTVS